MFPPRVPSDDPDVRKSVCGLFHRPGARNPNLGDGSPASAPGSWTHDARHQRPHAAGPPRRQRDHRRAVPDGAPRHAPRGRGALRSSHRPRVAIVHAWAGTILAGARDRSPSRDSMQLFVVVERDGRWVAEAVQNSRQLTLERQRFLDDVNGPAPPSQDRVTELVTLLGSSARPCASPVPPWVSPPSRSTGARCVLRILAVIATPDLASCRRWS